MALGTSLFELACKTWLTKSVFTGMQWSQNSTLWHFIYSSLVRNHICGDAGNVDVISLLYTFALHSRQEEAGGGREREKGEKWHNDVIITIAKPGRCHGDRDMWAGRWHSQWGCSDLLFTSSTAIEGVFLDKRSSDLRKGGVTQRRDGGVREK